MNVSAGLSFPSCAQSTYRMAVCAYHHDVGHKRTPEVLMQAEEDLLEEDLDVLSHYRRAGLLILLLLTQDLDVMKSGMLVGG